MNTTLISLSILSVLFTSYAELVSSERIYVDEIRQDSVIAKTCAIQSGLNNALKVFIKREPTTHELLKFTYSFSVLKEEITDTRYKAVLVFNFDTDEILKTFDKSILSKKIIPHALSTNIPVQETLEGNNTPSTIYDLDKPLLIRTSPTEWLESNRLKLEALISNCYEIISIKNNEIVLQTDKDHLMKIESSKLQPHGDMIELVI